MNRIMRALSLFIAVSMCFFIVESCNEVTVSPLNLYDSYYPISIGEERIYTVDSIAFDNFNNRIDTFYYRQREVIVDTFRNSQQNLMFLGQIFKEDTAGNIWNNNGTFFIEKSKHINLFYNKNKALL